MKYIVGSGWWCSEPTDDAINLERVKFGDEEIRGAEFHSLWYQSVSRFCTPDKIFIVDSCSPIKPPLDITDSDILFVSLNENPGHSTKHTGKYSGWMRSVLLSLSYALNNDCDYFVYVEQDVLLFGKDIIEKEISSMKKPFLFGEQRGFIQPLQQSFFIIQRAYIEQFLSRIYSIRAKDSKISPERKFAIATSAFLSLLPEFFFYQPKLTNLLGKLLHRMQTATLKLFAQFDVVKCGYGRARPMDFESDFFYFQHGDTAELNAYKEKFASSH